MGLIEKVLSFFTPNDQPMIPSIKVGSEDSSNRTTPIFSAPGDDSPPLDGDTAYISQSTGTGEYVAIGFIDDTQQKAAQGEKRLYARNSSGEVTAWCHLFQDGSIEIKNKLGAIQLSDNGDVSINGVTISADGKITAPSSIEAKVIQSDVVEASVSLKAIGKEIGVHIHQAPDGPTGPNL